MDCILYGVGSPYVYEIHESLVRLGWTVAALVMNQKGTPRPEGLGRVIAVEQLDDGLRLKPVILPVLTPGYRKAMECETRQLGYRTFATVIDPTAVMAGTATLAEGTLINAAVVLGAKARLGRFVLVNRSASIGHHVTIEDYATVGPGAILCGSCVVGRGAFIGAGAVINPERRVGRNAVVASGAVVVDDVLDHTLVAGNPAEVIREGIAGYNDVSV